jgi:hypothetical protein
VSHVRQRRLFLAVTPKAFLGRQIASLHAKETSMRMQFHPRAHGAFDMGNAERAGTFSTVELLCLWAVFGLALSALFEHFGLSVTLGLAMAG